MSTQMIPFNTEYDLMDKVNYWFMNCISMVYDIYTNLNVNWKFYDWSKIYGIYDWGKIYEFYDWGTSVCKDTSVYCNNNCVVIMAILSVFTVFNLMYHFILFMVKDKSIVLKKTKYGFNIMSCSRWNCKEYAVYGTKRGAVGERCIKHKTGEMTKVFGCEIPHCKGRVVKNLEVCRRHLFENNM